MKAYLLTTCAIFGLIVIAHVLRIAAEGHGVATDPWFLGMTCVAAGLCIWALRLLRLLTSTQARIP